MFSWSRVLLCAALPVVLPSAAQAEGLGCMAQSYGPEQLAEIEALSTAASFDAAAIDAAATRISDLSSAAASGCAAKNRWPEQAAYFATLYEIGRVSDATFRRSGKMTPEELRTVDETLAQRDRTELWDIVAQTLLAGSEGGPPEPTPQQQRVLAEFLVSTGLGTDKATIQNEVEMLGAMAMVRYGQREFDAAIARD